MLKDPEPFVKPGFKAKMHEYNENLVITFRYTKDTYGLFSNMAKHMPLSVNEMDFQSSEGLYQALKYPMYPEIQHNIGAAPYPYAAKKIAYSIDTPIYENWDNIKIDAMRLTLGVKYLTYPRRLQNLLYRSKGYTIVEKSIHDRFWGAKPKSWTQYNILVGHNILGRLWGRLRECIAVGDEVQTIQRFLEPVQTPFTVNNILFNKESVFTTRPIDPLASYG